MNYFSKNEIDGGAVVFDSIHPRWSYAKIIDNQQIIETAEKKPLSRNAIAGLYYFSRGSYFVESAMQSIIKDRSHQGMYYISSTLNELILSGKDVRAYQIESDEYSSFYSPENILSFEKLTTIRIKQ